MGVAIAGFGVGWILLSGGAGIENQLESPVIMSRTVGLAVSLVIAAISSKTSIRPVTPCVGLCVGLGDGPGA